MEIDLTPLINAGISGAVLLWFMFRLERILNRFERSLQLMARAVIRLLERRDREEASNLSNGSNRGAGARTVTSPRTVATESAISTTSGTADRNAMRRSAISNPSWCAVSK